MSRTRLSILAVPAVVLGVITSSISCKEKDRLQPEVPSSEAVLPGVEAAVRAIMALLQSEDPADRAAGAFALAEMGPMARSAVPALIEALSVSVALARQSGVLLSRL